MNIKFDISLTRSILFHRWALYPPGRVPGGVTVHVNDEDGDVDIETPTSLQVLWTPLLAGSTGVGPGVPRPTVAESVLVGLERQSGGRDFRI